MTRVSQQKDKIHLKNRIASPSKTVLYILAFIIPLLLVLISFARSNFAPFGDKDVITASGDNNYYVYYYELYDHVHSPDLFTKTEENNISSLFASESISGNSYITDLAYHISDPTNYIILLFDRSNIPAVLDILYAIKLALASLFFSIYLSKHFANRIADAEETINKDFEAEKENKKNKLNKKIKNGGGNVDEKASLKEKKDFIIGFVSDPKSKFAKALQSFDFLNLGLAIAYATSQFFVSKAMNPAYTLAIAIFPLIMLSLDKILEEKKWTSFALLSGIQFYLNIHVAIMTNIFVLFYVLLQSYSSVKDFLQAFIAYIKGLIISLLIAALQLNLISANPSFHEEFNLGFPIAKLTNSLKKVLRQIATQVTPNKAQFMYTSVDLYIGIALLFLVLLYICNKKISLADRIKNTALLLLLYTGSFISTSNYLFNGFYFKAVPTIYYGFCISFLAISMAYTLLINISGSKIIFIHLAGLLSVVMLVLPMINSAYDSATPVITSLEFLFGYYLLTLVFRNKSMTYKAYLATIALLFMIETTSSYSINVNVLGNGALIYGAEKNPSLKEYDFALTILEKHPGAKLYFYSSSKNALDPLEINLEGYDYIIAGANDLLDDCYQLEDSSTYYAAYQNPYAMKYVLFNEDIVNYSFDNSHPFYSLNTLAKNYLNGESIYNTNTGGNLEQSFANDAKEFHVKYTSEQNGNYYARYNQYAYLGNLGADNESEIAQLDTNANNVFSVAIMNDGSLQKINKYQEDLITNIKYGQNVLSFTSSKDGYLLLNTSLMSGKKLSIQNYSFLENSKNGIIVHVNKGQNTILLKPDHKGQWFALFLSIIGILAILFSSWKHNKKMKDDHNLKSKSDLSNTIKPCYKLSVSSEKVMDRLSSFIHKNYTYLAVFGIQLLILLITQMLTRTYPFGNHLILVDDGLSQVFPWTKGINIWAHDGDYFNTITTSQAVFTTSGADIVSRIVDPITNLPYALCSEKMLIPVFTLIYALTFSLSSLPLLFYLTHRNGKKMKSTDWRLISIGLSYGLSVFAISFISYKGFGFLLYLPLLIWALEKVVYEQKHFFYIIVLTIFMFKSPYYAFMICEFLFLYFFTMNFESIKDFFTKALHFGISSIASAGLSCLLLVPFYMATSNSAYSISDQEALPGITKFYTSFLDIFQLNKIFVKPIEITNLNWRASIYCGLGVLIFLTIYIINSNIALSTRIRKLALILLIFIGFNNELLNLAFHGFHKQSMVPCRFAIFFIFLIIECFYETLLNWENMARSKVLIAIAASVTFMVLMWSLKSQQLTLPTVASVLALLIYLGITIRYRAKKSVSDQKYLNSICILLVLELLINSYIAMPFEVGGDVNSILTTQSSIEELTDDTDARKPFTNTEVIGTTDYSISNFRNIQTITSFNSNISGNALYMMDKWGVLHYTNLITYGIGNPLSDMMLHVKYNIVDSTNDESYSIYPAIKTVDTLTLHENPYYLPFGFTIADDAAAAKWDATKASEYVTLFDYQNAFVNSQGLDNLYDTISFTEVDSENKATDSDKSYAVIGEPYKCLESNNSYKIYRNVEFIISDKINGPLYISLNDSLVYMGEANDEQRMFEAPIPIETLDETDYAVAKLNNDTRDQLFTLFSQTVTEDTNITDNSVKTSINLKEDDIVYLGMPYLNGLTAYIDGQEVEKFSYLGGIGISVPAGKHTIEIKYSVPGLDLGIIISSITLMILLVYVLILYKKKKNERSKTNVLETNVTDGTKSE